MADSWLRLLVESGNDGWMKRRKGSNRSSAADIHARRRRVMDLVYSGRTIQEIAAIEKLSIDTISKDYRAGLDEAGALLDRDGRVAVAIESLGRIRRRAQALFGDRPEHTTHQRHAVGLQAERLLNDLLDTSELLSSGADQERYSAYDASWGDEPPAGESPVGDEASGEPPHPPTEPQE